MASSESVALNRRRATPILGGSGRIPATGAGAEADTTPRRPVMDQKALRILFDTYWCPAGWREDGDIRTAPEDFDYAKRAGLMFDPVRLAHDQVVRWALDVRGRVRADEVADAFLASLTTRRLDLRSALGSYAVLRHFPDHPHKGRSKACKICGEQRTDEVATNLNALNFERFKWGGVRHDEIAYAAFDLERFVATDRPPSTAEDAAALRALLDAIEAAGPNTTAPQMQGRLGAGFPSNKEEREVILNILGFCGILRTPGHPAYWDQFVADQDRDDPGQRFVDMSYPACWWRGRDGLDRAAVRQVFPAL